MEPKAVDCEYGSGAPSLDVLQEVQKAYEQRLAVVEQVPRNRRMPLQVSVLKEWVADLSDQNQLLVRTVEELEADASTRLYMEQRKHSETVCELRAEIAVLRRRLARKDSDIRGLVEVLRRLRDLDYCSLEGIHFFEITESDIFGKCDWHQKNMAEGDLRHDHKLNSNKLKCEPRYRRES